MTAKVCDNDSEPTCKGMKLIFDLFKNKNKIKLVVT